MTKHGRGPRAVRMLAALALAGSAAVGLAACSSNPVGSAVTQALGTSAPVVATNGSLPSTYPKKAVPLVAGTVTSAVGSSVNGTRVWEVSITATKGFSGAVSTLSAAGMSIDSTAAASGGGIARLSSKAYAVTVTGGPKTVVYVVTQR